MDHMMPKMNGVETTKMLREMGYDRSIVALTANAVTGSSEMFLANGFDGYISKPIDLRELNASLNRLIRDKQPPEVVEAVRQELDRQKKASVPELVQKMLTNDKLAAAVMQDIENALTVLQKIDNGDLSGIDFELYTTTVHGMKSALANIGETKLSASAAALEKAGDAQKTDVIAAETPLFVQALQALVQKYKPDNANVTEDTSGDDTDFLKAKLHEIIDACQNFQKNEAKSALDELRRKSWSLAADDLLVELSVYLLRGEFKKIVSAAEEYLQSDT
jgi:CheY-like chemotaxis protein